MRPRRTLLSSEEFETIGRGLGVGVGVGSRGEMYYILLDI
jgi:hypothetical protein